VSRNSTTPLKRSAFSSTKTMSDLGTGRTETRLTVPCTRGSIVYPVCRMSPSTTLATVATGVFSKLRSKPLPLPVICGRSSETAVTSTPSYIAARAPPPFWLAVVVAAFTGCGWRGSMSSERTLSRMSICAASTPPPPTVAELQEANRTNEVKAKAARTLRRVVRYRPSLPTRTIIFAIPTVLTPTDRVR
jgi:hypothetical protein